MIKDYDNNFLNIFNNSLVGMILTNKDHIIININDHLLKLAELEQKDVIGKTGLELGILNEAFIKSIWEEITINEKLLNRELSFITKNNKTVNCLFSTEKILVNDKDYWLTTICDITARKNAESGLSESELRFRTLAKTAPVGIFETDVAGKTTYVNETWMSYTGLSFEEAMGDQWMHIIHPEDRIKQVDNWSRKTAMAEPSFTEYRIIDRQGNLRWISGKAVPIITNDGNISGYIGTMADVTELRLALELLRKSEDTLNKAQHISKIGSWEFNLLTGVLAWSAEEYLIFELEGCPQEKLFEAMRRKYHPDDLPKLDEKIKLAIETKEGYVFEHRIICNDGSIKYILGIAEVILNTNGEVVGMKGTGQDITEQKLAEQKLTERTEQLKELSTHLQNVREDERMNIAREIHDELGQQLTGLKMDIAWLMKKANQDDPAVKAKYNDVLLLIDGTVKSIRRIATELRPSIIDDLGLNAALEWLVSEFSERLNIEIRYENNFDDKHIAPEISISMFRILQESLTNIAKHANAGNASITFEKLDDAVHLSVQDDGIGFDMSAKPNYMTFGLLGIKERTAMMKGDFAVLSEPGGGTKIEVTIPVK